MSPFFTTTRELFGFAATALDLLLVFATDEELFGLELVEAVLVDFGLVVVFATVLLLEEELGFMRETSTSRADVEVEIGVKLLGGLSLDASKPARDLPRERSLWHRAAVPFRGIIRPCLHIVATAVKRPITRVSQPTAAGAAGGEKTTKYDRTHHHDKGSQRA